MLGTLHNLPSQASATRGSIECGSHLLNRYRRSSAWFITALELAKYLPNYSQSSKMCILIQPDVCWGRHQFDLDASDCRTDLTIWLH
jgi:hypothetical protein